MESNYDLVVVFGGGYLGEDSNKPGLDTLSRLKKAKEVWDENESASVFVSAGLHHPNAERDRVLAEDMKRWLKERGIPNSKIYTEESSYDTYTGVVSLWNLVRKNDFERVCLVSNKLHLKRARAMVGAVKWSRPWLWPQPTNFFLEPSSESSMVDDSKIEYRSWAASFIFFIFPMGRTLKKWRKTGKFPYDHL